MNPVASKINEIADKIAAEGMILRAADVRAGAIEIERLRALLKLSLDFIPPSGEWDEVTRMREKILETVGPDD